MPEKNFMTSSYGDNKYSKVQELNGSMSVHATAYDELTTKLRGGLGNAD